MIIFVRITFPVDEVLKSTTMRSRVEDRLDFIVFFVVNQKRGRTIVRIRVKDCVLDERSNEGNMKDGVNIPGGRQSKTYSSG